MNSNVEMGLNFFKVNLYKHATWTCHLNFKMSFEVALDTLCLHVISVVIIISNIFLQNLDMVLYKLIRRV